MRRARSLALLLFSLQLSLPAAAQTQDPDLQLLASQLGSAPNVMILVDTSGSMKHIVWHESFDPKILQSVGSPCAATGNMTVYRNDRTAGMCPGSGYTGDYCPENDTGGTLSGFRVPGVETSGNPGSATISCAKANFPGANCSSIPSFFGCSVGTTNLTIRLNDYDTGTDIDPVDGVNFDTPNEVTYWAPNYLHWILKRAAAGTLPSNIPLETRKMAAKRVIKDIIKEVNPTRPDGTIDQRVRFGLARMHDTQGGGSDWNGGFVVEPIADNNRPALLTALTGSKIDAPGYARTPLSESLVDVARYFVGNHPNSIGRTGLGYYSVYNRNTTDGTSSSTAPASPIVANIPCRENFVIVVTDGEPTEDANNHNGTDFIRTFGTNFDGDTDLITNVPPDFNDSLADVAAYLFQTDLIADSEMPNKQNIVTYTIGFALDQRLLENTAANGQGAYYTASNGTALADNLRISLEDIVLRAGSFTAAAVPSSRSALGDGFYTTYFEPEQRGRLYRGHLQAYRLTDTFGIIGNDGQSAVDPATGAFYEPRTNFFWDSALTLADPNNARSVYFNPALPMADPNFTAANITAANLGITSADLPKYVSPPAAPITTTEQLADALVNYVLGQDRFDEDLDNNVTELRPTVLGDIFHSTPRVVAPPALFLANEPSFGPIGDPNSFAERYARRDKMIYAGANDGMLHAFLAGRFRTGDDPMTPTVESSYYDMGTGVEKFGFVPRSMFPTLKQHTLKGAHPVFVDGAISVADAWFPSSSTDSVKDPNEWTTAIVVGMRNGAESYLALDVTDPSATGSVPHGPYPKFLWELNDPNEPLGRTWSRAVITRVRLRGALTDDYCGVSNGDGSAGPGLPGNCREEWVAIFGAGYLEQGDPSATGFLSDPNAAAWDDDSKGIFMVSLQTGQVLARVSYQSGSTPLAQMRYSFPSEPAVLDLNGDGFADVVYIGDTGGQLWKWDISTTGVRDMTGRVPTSVWPVDRFFVAPQASNGHRRSFFYPPTAALSGGKLVLGIGTGERTKADYRTTGGDENRYYVIQDRTPVGTGAFAGLPLGESNLTLLAANGVDTNLTDYGFYLIADRDEKFISDSVAFAGFVITASYVPKPPNPAAPCAGGGEAILYIFSLSNGAGFFPAGEPGRIDSRRVSVGAGMPSSAGVTVSGDNARITLQMSDSSVKSRPGPPPNESPVDIIFWEQQF
jgi:hypothetical protein